jgi:hypothetical protein
LVNKLRTTGLLIDKKQKYKSQVLTEEKLDDMGGPDMNIHLENHYKRLAQETGV